MYIYILNATLNGKLISEILCDRLTVSGIITLSENGENQTSEYFDYTSFCEERNLKCIKMNSYNFSDSEDRDRIEKLEIDLIIIASWQRLLPSWLIQKCSIGIIGAHGSHEGISRGRGRSPQNWALMMGRGRFSLSIFWIEEGTDDGAVIDTKEFEYSSTDSILTSYIKVNMYKADMILRNIENGRIERKEGIKQEKDGLYLPQRKKEDGKIDWNRDAADIYNMIRALTKPYPGAFTCRGTIEYIIWAGRPVMCSDVSYLYESACNGTVISILEGSALVKCGTNLLLIEACSNFEKIEEGMVFESADYKEQLQTIVDRHREKYNTPLSRLVLDEIE